MNDGTAVPRPRTASPIERIFPRVEQEERSSGNVTTADYLRGFLREYPAWKQAEAGRISQTLDAMGYLPFGVPSFRSPAMKARHEQAVRSTPLRNARGAAGRDPLYWGQA